jgi:hypothetical protein
MANNNNGDDDGNGSKIVIEMDGRIVYEFTEKSVENSESFPGNETDPQYVTSLLGNTNEQQQQQSLDMNKYGCAYTGRHDHGPLPEQKRNPDHEKTLKFLEQARKNVGEYLNSTVKQQQQQNKN